MRLLRLREVEIDSDDRVFRHGRLWASVIWLAGAAAAAALLIYAYTAKWPPGYIFGAPLLIFMLLTRRMVAARFHRSNWLARMNMTGIYVQYRSYLNYRFPAEEPSVVLLPFGEIVSARLIKERVETPDPARPGITQTQYLRHIEVEVSCDTEPLEQALQKERAEPAPVERHWYGTSSTVYRDYPVRVSEPKFVRIRWDVVPGARKFLELMRPNTLIADPVSLTQNFTQLKSLSREDQQKKLRELIARGEIIAAIYVARRLYDCSAGQAKQMVDALCESKAAR